MCGIFGYIGPRRPATVCLDGLKQLEYRGYDSAGIAGIFEGQLHFRKEAGKISVLQETLDLDPLHLDLAIAHTRWATNGKPTKKTPIPTSIRTILSRLSITASSKITPTCAIC